MQKEIQRNLVLVHKKDKRAEREARLTMKWSELLKMHKLMRNRINRTKG